MTENIEQITKEFIYALFKFKTYFLDYEEYEKQISTKEKPRMGLKSSLDPDFKLKELETEFDKIDEGYWRCCTITNYMEYMKNQVKKITNTIDNFFSKCETRKNEYGNKKNRLLDEIIKYQDELKKIQNDNESNNFSNVYDSLNESNRFGSHGNDKSNTNLNDNNSNNNINMKQFGSNKPNQNTTTTSFMKSPQNGNVKTTSLFNSNRNFQNNTQKSSKHQGMNANQMNILMSQNKDELMNQFMFGSFHESLRQPPARQPPTKPIPAPNKPNQNNPLSQQFKPKQNKFNLSLNQPMQSTPNQFNNMSQFKSQYKKPLGLPNEREFYVETNELKEQRLKKEMEKDNQIRQQIKTQATMRKQQLLQLSLSVEEMLLIEKETELCIDAVLFDSTKSLWDKESSFFHHALKKQGKIVIIIETTEGKKFGCYIEKDVEDIGKYVDDPNAFLFVFEHGKMMKFPIRDNRYAIQVFDQQNDNLFAIGYSWGMLNSSGDVIIKKRELKDKCVCYQSSYDYRGRENALIGRKGNFEVKNFVVFALSPHHKMIQLLSDSIRVPQLHYFELWTNKEIGDVLFDNTKHLWTINKSVFNDKIQRKYQLLFIIETKQKEIFGYYFNGEIPLETNKEIECDDKSFHFILQSNGRLERPMKFEVKETQKGGICLYENDDERLIRLGDIMLYKHEQRALSYCSQHDEVFKYPKVEIENKNKEKKKVIMNVYSNDNETWKSFNPTRFYVIQMM